MRLGIVTPIVNLNPRFDPPSWEYEGGMDEIVAVARCAEALGYSWLTCSEHSVIPGPIAASRGGRYWDPVVTFAYVAANTSTISLLTYVLVLAYHHPLEVLKQYGSLDRASRGRLVLGVGVGTLTGEFEALGIDPEGRGARADDAIAAIRAGFGQLEPVYAGSHYRFNGLVVDPHGVQVDIPIWVGGRTTRSLRRALDLGDGWIPFGLDLDALRSMLSDDAFAARLAERPGFELVLAPEPPLDPLGQPDITRATVEAYRDLGATALNLRVVHASFDHYCEQLAAMTDLVGTLGD